MHIRSFCVPFVAVFMVACGAAENPDPATRSAPAATVAPDLDAIAKSIVTRTAAVKAGDVVLVLGGVRDLELLENLAVQVAAVGGQPLLVVNSERMTRRSYDDVPAQYDSVAPAWQRIVNENADVVITVDITETPDLLANVPAERVAARVRASAPIDALALRRGVRIVEVGNGLYPTHARAAQLGISRDELARIFWSSLAADFTALETNATRTQEILRTARELHITTPNGTDLRARLKPGARIFVSAGTVPSVEEVGKGAMRAAYIPAGEVYTLLEPGSAEGKLVVDQYPYQGKMIQNLTLEISKGRMTSFSAPSGIEHMKATYDAATGGRDLVSMIDIGINPAISNSAGSSIRTWVPEGTVTVIVGSDTWAGGTNRTSFNINPFLTNATVRADGRVIVQDGKLAI